MYRRACYNEPIGTFTIRDRALRRGFEPVGIGPRTRGYSVADQWPVRAGMTWSA
jgi:hypothetical protein